MRDVKHIMPGLAPTAVRFSPGHQAHARPARHPRSDHLSRSEVSLSLSSHSILPLTESDSSDMYPMPTLVSQSDDESDSDDDSDHGSDADTDPGDIESDTEALTDDLHIPMPPLAEL